VATSNSLLDKFAKRRKPLLESLASVWSQTGRFTWHTNDGRTLLERGEPAGEAIHAPFDYGTLSIEGGDRSLQPLLAAQARLLQEAIDGQDEIDQLTHDLMRTTDQLVALYEVSAAARAGRDLDNMVRTCLAQAASLTYARQAILLIREAARGNSVEPTQVFTYPDKDSLSAASTSALLSMLANIHEPHIANTPQECAALCGEPLASRLLVAPITIGSEIDAGLCVLDKPSDFTSNNLKLVTALADAASSFLERERNYRRELSQARLRRELEIAAEIQSRLLQRQVPTVPGAQVVAFSRPAGEVGGDFFDVQVLPGDIVALALGDVTGRGVPAALFMSMARALLRVGLQTTHSPRSAVEHLNAGLAEDLSNSDMLLTLFVATFDPASRELRAVNCGHSPVLVHCCERTEVWEADGPPLGMPTGLMSAERSRALSPGDVLVVLSDGFNETRDSAGALIGIEPLVEAVQRSAPQDAAAIAATLHQLVAGIGGSFAPEDDQTLIVMKVA
jgi:sigma-B regulation protein RsbU (phosphoserine phosphatase)